MLYGFFFRDDALVKAPVFIDSLIVYGGDK